LEEHDDYKGLESKCRLLYSESNPTWIRTQLGCAFRTSSSTKTCAFNPTRCRSPTFIYKGFGGDYVNKGVGSLGINQAT
jgi:hypothetical protein